MLHDHLLARLGSDAAEVAGRYGNFHQVAQLVLGANLPRVGQGHLALGIVDLLHHHLAGVHLHLTLLGIDDGAHVGGLAEVLFICGNQRGFDR